MAKPSQNQNGHRKHENRSLISRQFKGIRMRKWGKWVSEIRMSNNRGRIWLGSYDTPEKAARAYDFAVYCLKGSKARLNFPQTPPEIPFASSLSPRRIQAAAAKYAAEEFPPPSEHAAFSSSGSGAECGNDGQENSAFSSSGAEVECGNDGQENSAFSDSVSEDVDNGENLTLQDFPLVDLDVLMEDFGGLL